MFRNGWNRYRMFFQQSLQRGATATSITVISSLVGVCVVSTITDIVTSIAEKSTPRETLLAFAGGVAVWTLLVFIFTAVIAYDRYKHDQKQFRKEVGFPE